MGYGFTYNFYTVISFAVPSYIMLFGWITLLGLSFMALHTLQTKNARQQVWKLAVNILKMIYGDFLEKPPDAEQVNEMDFLQFLTSGTYTLYNKKVANIMLLFQIYSVMLTYGCSVLTFWINFMIAESSACDDQLDCFPLNEAGKPIQTEPVENCTEYENSGYAVQCLTVPFNYVDAIGNAGSVVVVGLLVMNTVSAISAGVHSISCKSLIVVFDIVFILSLCPLLILPLAYVYQTVVTGGLNFSIQSYTYYIAFTWMYSLAGLSFPSPIPAQIFNCICKIGSWIKKAIRCALRV